MDSDDDCLMEAYDQFLKDDVKPAVTDEIKYPPIPASEECNNDSAEEEYLLAAYQEYINDAEEWPNFENVSKNHKYHVAGRGGESLPLLIGECGRLVPVYDENSDFVQFHPFNMPKVRVRRVHIIGIIVNIKKGTSHFRFQVYDGTGRLDVLYKLEWLENQRKKRAEMDRLHKVDEKNVARAERLMALKIENKGRPLNAAQQRIKKFQREHARWWEDTREGMLGKPLLLGSYVHVFGFCNIERNKASRTNVVKDNNFWAGGIMPRLLFNAFDVRCMTEKTYNETLMKWIDTVFKEKYVDPRMSAITSSCAAATVKKKNRQTQ